MLRWLSLVLLVIVVAGVRSGDNDLEARALKELQPRLCTIKGEAIPISDALAQLQKQTGNAVVDRRRAGADLTVKLGLDGATFWQALHALARAADCGISTYQPDGSVALVDRLGSAVPTIEHGIVRILVKRRAIVRDDENGLSACIVTLDVAWEPRFEAYFLEVGEVRAVFGPDADGKSMKATAPAQGKVSLWGRYAKPNSAAEIEIRLPAPPRSVATIKSLEGRLSLTGPGSMLTFVFADLGAVKKGSVTQTRDGVRASLIGFKKQSRHWEATLQVAEPPLFVTLESFQQGDLTSHNRVALVQGEGANQVVWPGILDEGDQYSFRIAANENKGTPADWKLTCRAPPGPIVQVPTPFVIKDLPLP